VQTVFGWHVIKLLSITPAKMRPFDEVKAQIESDLKRQKAGQKFATTADQLQNLVYEQADSLQPAAKAINVPLRTSPLVTRSQAQAIALGNAKFVQALFSPDALQSKRNTDAIEVGPNALMAARVIEHRPAQPRPFDDVKEEIRRQLALRSASESAQAAGREKLALLEKGASDKQAGLAFSAPMTVTRNPSQQGVSPEALPRIFQVDATKLPKYVGATNERAGFSIYRVSKVIAPPPPDDTRLAAVSARISEQLGRELMSAYVASLKAKSDVKINQANLEKK
jgi:peptidyl-prolyl cis-trans isomerase D